jgi:hypothetical protein
MKLIPKPHMIKSIRSRNWHLSGAIQELVDNSLGHGQATKIGVVIDNRDGVGVIDNGIGADDINRLFRIGDASSHDKLDEIGQYGVGAKNATIYIGDRVSVSTVRDGRRHNKTVDWGNVEQRGEWPDGYTGKGIQTDEPSGTTVMVTKLARTYHFSSSERLARDLGQVFAPALRNGIKISVVHRLKGGEKQTIAVEPYNPPDLTDEIEIAGEVDTARGPLRWTGRAGLSDRLGDRYGVHIGFGHRIVESTRDPFGRENAPTLYVEVMLDATTPWKHSLSEHKDKVVRNRAALVDSIHEQIKELLKKSVDQSSYLALRNLAVPIEAKLTKALKGAGATFIDPEQETDEPGWGEEDTDSTPNKKPRARDTADHGERAKEAKPPGGVQINWVEPDKLAGKLYDWEISPTRMVLDLDAEQFKPTIGYPPKLRDQAVIQIVASLLANAIVVQYRLEEASLRGALTPKLRRQLDEWDGLDGSRLTPRLARAILEAA